MGRDRTKALSLTKKVKDTVAERDSIDGCPCCVVCSAPGNPEAHYISRQQGGLGVEENIVTLCRSCHRRYDNEDRLKLKPVIRKYLMTQYPYWNEDDIVFEKGTE